MEEEKNLQEDTLKKNSLAKESSSFFDPSLNKEFIEIDNEEYDDQNLQKSEIADAAQIEYENSEVFDIVGKPNQNKEFKKLEDKNKKENLEYINGDQPNNNVTEKNTIDEQESKKKPKKIEPFLDIKENFVSTVQEAEEIASTNKGEIDQPVEKVVEDAHKDTKKKTGRFMRYFYIACFIVNVVSFGVFLGINSQSRAPFENILNNSNGWFLVAALMCFVATMLIEALRYYILILRGTKKSRLNVSYNTAAIGKFYDFITPLSTGGQSFQISYLIKRKVEPSFAATVPVTKYVYNQFCYLLIIILLFILSGQPKFSDFGATFIGVAAYIGLAWQVLLLFIVFFFSTSKRLAPACTIGVLKFLHKIKIIKDYRETYVKVLRFVHDYQKSFKKFFTDFFSFFVMFVSSVLLILVRCLIPYFLYCTFVVYQPGLLLSICARTLFCELAMGIWVLPGNAVFADLAFFTLFKPLFTNGTLFWALLFWRLISYYFYLVQGAIIVPLCKSRDKKFKTPKEATAQQK